MLEKRLLTKRFDKYDGLNIKTYQTLEGYEALKKAFNMSKEDIIKEVKMSRLTGRGGANFPTHIKMTSMLNETGEKFVVCNADEGEPGNFKDRYLMENDPYQLIEGMTISAYAIDAHKGYIYIRGEYNEAINRLQKAIERAYMNKTLGKHILDTDFSFDLEIRRGAGAYVCGEEFALIESIEGHAGRTRVKPPFPTQEGIFKHPTLINNVETFSTLCEIVLNGGKAYSQIGSNYASGTKLISLSGNVKHKGLFEVPYGTTIMDVITECGGGTNGDIPIQMVQIGGACGPIIPPRLLHMDIDNEAFEIFDAKMGAGAIIVIDENYDLFEIVLKNMQFFLHESCGKCAPCREGHFQMVKILERFVDYKATKKDYQSLKTLAEVIHDTTLCGLGQTSTTSVISTMTYFDEVYQKRIEQSKDVK
jgi:NADH-quinone oxidoreductase subunit F